MGGQDFVGYVGQRNARKPQVVPFFFVVDCISSVADLYGFCYLSQKSVVAVDACHIHDVVRDI